MGSYSDIALRYATFFSTGLRSVARNKLRSFLSVLGVVFGVMAVMAIICIGRGAKQEAVRQVEQLGTCNVYIRQLELSPEQKAEAARRQVEGLNGGDYDRLAGAGAHVRQVAGLKELTVPVYGTLRQVTPQVAACTANYAGLLNLEVTAGRFIRQSDVDGYRMVCVLGSDVAEKLGKDGRLHRGLRIGEQVFTIVGRLDRVRPGDSSSSGAVSVRNHNEMILVPMNAARWLPGKQGGPRLAAGGAEPGFSEIIVQVSESRHVINTAAVIRRIMEQRHRGIADYQVMVPLELLHQSRKTRETFNLFLGVIAGISLLVGGIGIMNIMLATVSERIREIGIRRAVGATRADIVMHFLVESVILTFSGGLVGVAAGTGAVALAAAVTGWNSALTAWAIVLPLAMSVLVGLFFGLYPAYKAACLDPVAALRHE